MNFMRKQGSETTLKKTWIFFHKLSFQFVFSNPFNVLDEGETLVKISKFFHTLLITYAAVNGYLELSLLKGRQKFSTSNLEVYKFWESCIGGIKGGGGIPPPVGGSAPPPPLRQKKNGHNQSFSTIFWIFAPSELHFAPSMPTPTNNNYFWCRHWIRESSPYYVYYDEPLPSKI